MLLCRQSYPFTGEMVREVLILKPDQNFGNENITNIVCKLTLF